MIRLIVLLPLILVGCAGDADQKKDEAKEKPKVKLTPQLVARVQSRPGGKDFVLLEAYGKWSYPEGTLLYSYGENGRTAALETSGEKLGQFVAADVKSGSVEIGDGVYFRPVAPVVKAIDSAPEPVVKPSPTVAPVPSPAAPKLDNSSVIEPVPLPSY